MSAIELNIREQDGCLIAEIDLDLTDIFISQHLKGELLSLLDADAPRERVILDFDQVGFIDSRAIGILMTVALDAKKRGKQLVLVNLQPKVAQLFRLAEGDTIVQIYSDVEEALKAD